MQEDILRLQEENRRLRGMLKVYEQLTGHMFSSFNLYTIPTHLMQQQQFNGYNYNTMAYYSHQQELNPHYVQDQLGHHPNYDYNHHDPLPTAYWNNSDTISYKDQTTSITEPTATTTKHKVRFSDQSKKTTTTAVNNEFQQLRRSANSIPHHSSPSITDQKILTANFKKQTRSGKWYTRRFTFNIEEGVIRYYKIEDGDLLGKFNCVDIVKHGIKDKSTHIFFLETKIKGYAIQASNADEVNLWIRTIEQCKIESSQQEKGEISGYLGKKTSSGDKVQYRWFELSSPHLSYYHSRSDKLPSETFLLSNITQLTPRNRHFSLKHKDRVYHLTATTEDQMRKWVKAIAKARAKLTNEDISNINDIPPNEEETESDDLAFRLEEEERQRRLIEEQRQIHPKGYKGYLLKQSSSGKWQERWFIIDSKTSTLYYYSEKNGTLLGSIQLTSKTKYTTGHDTIFHIDQGSRVFHLQASSIEKKDSWLSHLEKATLRTQLFNGVESAWTNKKQHPNPETNVTADTPTTNSTRGRGWFLSE